MIFYLQDGIHCYSQKETDIFTVKHGSLEIISTFLAQVKHKTFGRDLRDYSLQSLIV